MATVGRVERPSDAMVRLASQKMPSGILHGPGILLMKDQITVPCGVDGC